eukprot:SAG31_NODE_11641_length_1011_cov_0.841009_1_plen_76_part_10
MKLIAQLAIAWCDCSFTFGMTYSRMRNTGFGGTTHRKGTEGGVEITCVSEAVQLFANHFWCNSLEHAARYKRVDAA